jgi:hypothetical protein
MVHPPSRLLGHRVQYGVHPSSVLGMLNDRAGMSALSTNKSSLNHKVPETKSQQDQGVHLDDIKKESMEGQGSS